MGVGGIGMSGIAEVVLGLGYEVSGSDLCASNLTDRLKTLGIKFNEGHDACNVNNADLVVISAAVPSDNPERLEAENRGIPIVPRGDMLAELTKLKRSVAVVGSHGKTTTAAMIACMLNFEGLDPTFIIGGKMRAFGSNAKLGEGPFIVVEADESDRSFLQLSPDIAVLTNLDEEHLDAYTSMEDLEASFLKFAYSVNSKGCSVICWDDQRLQAIGSAMSAKILTYGIENTKSKIFADQIELGPLNSRAQVRIRDKDGLDEFELKLAVPGRHNIQNALAAICVGHYLGISTENIISALEEFHGADRRFEVIGEVDGITIIDDYGHHPTEIKAVIETARLRSPSRLKVVFQPHRYSRTARLTEQFGSSLSLADDVILTEIYSASEETIPGVSAEIIAAAIRNTGAVSVNILDSFEKIIETLVVDSHPGDLIITLGAGSISSLPRELLKALVASRKGKP